ALLAATSDYKIPATELYLVANSGLEPEFSVVERSTPSILTSTVSAAVKVDTRLMIDRVYEAAKRGGVGFNVASIPPDFHAVSRGPFDPVYMEALFKVGEDLGKSATPFANQPPPYPGGPSTKPPLDPEKTGAH